MKLIWSTQRTPVRLHSPLRMLAEEYTLRETADGDENLFFVSGPSDACELRGTPAGVQISGGSAAAQLRAVGSALSGLAALGPAIVESTPFDTFGIMIDCSRNAVMRVDHVKRWLRRLALLGYNQAMLYTEDTYEIPGEPRFGFQRGRYTQAELREMDEYAAGLGMELVGCIQTLAHLEQILRWHDYKDVKDFDSTLLAGEEKTYALVEKMLDAIGGALRTRRIHIGMDEAWHLGRGAFLDRNGAVPKFDILNQHLARVVKLCGDRGLKPMIWSDMYFRLGSPSHEYYDSACVIPPEVAAAIPKEVQLVYWDYYHADTAFYLDYIAKHRALGGEPLVASGIWTWSQLWYNRRLTEANAGACVDACRTAGVKELVFTMWGDDGAYCDFDSALAGLAWAAERAYAPDARDDIRLRMRFRAVCGGDYAAVVRASEVTENHAPGLLWDDPILGIFYNEGGPKAPPSKLEIQQSFARLADTLAGIGDSPHAGDLDHARILAGTLADKMALRIRLLDAYDMRNRKELAAVVQDADAVADRFEVLAESWRRGWMRRNKPQGFEVIQLRMAQQIMRHRELARRVEELLSGEVSAIPELDGRPVESHGMGQNWRSLASGSVSV